MNTALTRILHTSMPSSSRLHEKEELQLLNDRFSAYVARVRALSQQASDTSVFLTSIKILEEEITALKNLYETELEKLRKEINVRAFEINSLRAQYNKEHKFIGDLQSRLTIETDKNSRLMDEINILQRKVSNLEHEIQEAHIASQIPEKHLEQLQATVENLTLEVDQWKQRYEQEQMAGQRSEDKLDQVMKKVEFSEQIQNQQIRDYQSRLDAAASTILNLEAHVQELMMKEVSAGELLRQIQEEADEKLREYQTNCEEQYSRNLSTLKAQTDSDSDAVRRLTQEKTQLTGRVQQLQTRIMNLEMQVANLHQEKKTMEDAVTSERNQWADHIRILEKKLRDLQDLLAVKAHEAHKSNVPLRAEIETLKALLGEEEKRLQVLMSMSPLHQSPMLHLPASTQIPTSSLMAIKSAASSHLQPTLPSSHVQSLTDNRKVQPLRETFIRTQLGTMRASSVPNMTLLTPDHNFSSDFFYTPGAISPNYPYSPSPVLNTLCIPEDLRAIEEGAMRYDADYCAGFADSSKQGSPQLAAETRYHYESSPSISRLHVERSPPPAIPRALGPVKGRTKSAPVKPQSVTRSHQSGDAKAKEEKWKYVPADFGCGRDHFQKMFHDLPDNTLHPKQRAKSSPIERQIPSGLNNYTVSTSNATGDIKILEVNQDGKFVRLVNSGPRETNIGGFMIKQNENGLPVAVFQYPQNVKFLPDSTITVWSAMNGPNVHKPPTDFFWKDHQKWGTGPKSSIILCQPNGQAVAWSTPAHRYSKEMMCENAKSQAGHDGADSQGVEPREDEGLAEEIMDSVLSKSEPAKLRRKKQPPTLISSGMFSSTAGAGQQSEQQQPKRSEPAPGLTCYGAPAQRVGSAPLRIIGSNNHRNIPPTIRGDGTFANKPFGSILKASPPGHPSSYQDQFSTEMRDQAGILATA